MRYLFILITILSFALISCNKFSKIQKSRDYEYKLTKANEYYEKKKYKFAQQLYEELFPVFKGTDKFESLYYKYAFCFYYEEMYGSAENLFKEYLEVFPNSRHAEELNFMRGLCFYKQSPKIELDQTNTLKAMNMMQNFINIHPGSDKIKEATETIDKCRAKLEQKDFRTAQLYFNLSEYRAAAIAFSNLLNNFPESTSGENYKLMVVKSYFKFAKMSISSKQEERYVKVISEYEDFVDRYPESKLLKIAETYSNQSQNQIKLIQNEQTSSSSKR
jgi:outer membrane protein assembly factor BamD